MIDSAKIIFFPFTVSEYGVPDRHFATFDEALAEYRRPNPGRMPRTLFNADRCDAEQVDGSWLFNDGLTESERELL